MVSQASTEHRTTRWALRHIPHRLVWTERAVRVGLWAAAAVTVVTTVGIILALAGPTWDFFRAVSVTEFVSGTKWTPLFADAAYGVLPLVAATLEVMLIALAIAVPLGLGTAIYLSEYAGRRMRAVLKPTVELLAGVPTVVYGFVALQLLNPALREIWPGSNGPDFQNMLVAGVAMGMMIVPTVASVAEDACRAVPVSLRDGAYALGATPRSVATRVVVPAALSGVVAAVVLGVSRAIGETMIVTIAAGLVANEVQLNPIRAAETLTAYIAAAGQGDVPVGTTHYNTIFAVGALLFLLTFVLNALSTRLVHRYRERYE